MIYIVPPPKFLRPDRGPRFHCEEITPIQGQANAKDY